MSEAITPARHAERLLRLPAVIERVGLKRTAIYGQIKAGAFPKPVAIGSRAVAWPESQVQAWIDRRVDPSHG